jgi:multicomponent Na+:H+ antiporter subunit E
MASALVMRAAAFCLLWLILAGFKSSDIPAAALAVAAATWVSLQLLRPGELGLSPLGLTRLALRFPYQSVVAGLDVAWCAFAPGMPLRPGFVTFAPRLPPGLARDAFTAYASLLPGTLPVETTDDGLLLVHCLDVAQPAAAQLAKDEAQFAAALGCQLAGRERNG